MVDVWSVGDDDAGLKSELTWSRPLVVLDGFGGVTVDVGNVGGVELFNSAARDEFCVKLDRRDLWSPWIPGSGVGGVRELLAVGNFWLEDDFLRFLSAFFSVSAIKLLVSGRSCCVDGGCGGATGVLGGTGETIGDDGAAEGDCNDAFWLNKPGSCLIIGKFEFGLGPIPWIILFWEFIILDKIGFDPKWPIGGKFIDGKSIIGLLIWFQ